MVSNADFASVADTSVLSPRQADGSLPNVDFLHLAAGSDLIDKGVSVGFPHVGAAPDLGAFEYGAPIPDGGGSGAGGSAASAGAGGGGAGGAGRRWRSDGTGSFATPAQAQAARVGAAGTGGATTWARSSEASRWRSVGVRRRCWRMRRVVSSVGAQASVAADWRCAAESGAWPVRQRVIPVASARPGSESAAACSCRLSEPRGAFPAAVYRLRPRPGFDR